MSASGLDRGDLERRAREQRAAAKNDVFQTFMPPLKVFTRVSLTSCTSRIKSIFNICSLKLEKCENLLLVCFFRKSKWNDL